MRLLIYVEPTSYILPLWREIKAQSRAEAYAVFLGENISQQWDIDLAGDEQVEVLHGNFLVKLARLSKLVAQPGVELIGLAGWGHPLLMAALLLGWANKISVTVGSDTQFDSLKAGWRRAFKRLIFPLLFRMPKLFFPAGSRQGAYIQRYGVPQSRIRIAQMTVDVRSIMAQVDRYRKESAPLVSPDKPTVFLYVGRLESYKGVVDLLEAFVNLGAEMERSRLIIVGDGSLRSKVETFVRAYPSIEYLGRLAGEPLWRAYSGANVFVLPSHVEPWGLVINEAMAASLAVIATDRVGCVDDLVHEGENGRVVPSASPVCLAEAMRTFIHQPEIAATMGQISRQMISTWTIEDEARIMMTAWDELK